MLKVENIKKSYREPDGKRLPILDVPRLELAAGEQVVIRGRSGGGKTTLLNFIAGLTTVDAGEIVIHGTDVTRLARSGPRPLPRRHIGFVFQTFNLLAGFTALENVLLGMTFTGQRHDPSGRAELLDRVGLGHRLTHKPARAVGRRAAAGGRGPGAGQSARAAAGRRTDGQHRPGPSATGDRPVARRLPRRRTWRCCW